MLVQRWATLQIAMSNIRALFGAFAKLHNFCIDIDTNKESNYTLLDLDADWVYITINESGYIVVESDKESNEKLCKDLMSGGSHFKMLQIKVIVIITNT